MKQVVYVRSFPAAPDLRRDCDDLHVHEIAVRGDADFDAVPSVLLGIFAAGPQSGGVFPENLPHAVFRLGDEQRIVGTHRQPRHQFHSRGKDRQEQHRRHDGFQQ